MSTIFNVQSWVHLGDNIINFIFFSKIKEYIESNNIIIHYRCHEKYHKNLNDFNCSENIVILPWENIGYILWQRTVFEIMPANCAYEETLCLMFNVFLQNHNIPITVNSFDYTDKDLFVRYQNLDNKYKNIDILVVNSYPLSGQYNYNVLDWNIFLTKLSKKYTIATTEKVNDNIISLQDFSVKNIASIATNVKKIITINTGPSIPLYNTDILQNVDFIYMFCDDHTFKTPKIVRLQNINDLEFML